MTKKLSICMIVKDEEKNLRRCLESIIPLLQKEYTELIIVDTGSTDKTINIAGEFTKDIFFHEWNGNFSEMRNISISYATGEWIFILDADEELETPSELITLLESSNLNNFNTVRIKEKNLLSLKSNKYVYHVQERLFRNDGTFEYRGTIHNQPVYKHPIFITDAIRLMHYGYINEDKDLMEKKFKRTAGMLLKELKEEPENVYYRFQLARSYMMHGDYFIALEEITKAFKSMKKQDSNLIVHRYYVFGEYARMSLHAKKYQQVVEICKEGLSYNKNYLDLYYYMGHALLSIEEEKQGVEALEHYIKLYLLYNKNEIDLSTFTAVEMYALDENAYSSTLDRIINILYKDKSLNFNKKQYELWLDKVENIQQRYKMIIKLFIIKKDFELLKNYFIKINKENYHQFINILETYKKDLTEEEKRCMEYLFSSVEGEYGLLNSIRICKNKNKSKLLIEFINNYNIIDYIDDVIIEFINYLLENKYLNRFFRKINSTKIKLIVKVLIDKEEKLDYFLESLQSDFTFNDFHNNRIYISIANITLLSMIEKERDSTLEIQSDVLKIFDNYLTKGFEHIKYIYNIEHIRIIYKNITNKEEKFLSLIYLANNSFEKKDFKNYHKLILEAIEEYPYFSKLLKIHVSNRLECRK